VEKGFQGGGVSNLSKEEVGKIGSNLRGQMGKGGAVIEPYGVQHKRQKKPKKKKKKTQNGGPPGRRFKEVGHLNGYWQGSILSSVPPAKSTRGGTFLTALGAWANPRRGHVGRPLGHIDVRNKTSPKDRLRKKVLILKSRLEKRDSSRGEEKDLNKGAL